MFTKRNRLEVAPELEPRVLLAGAVPGAVVAEGDQTDVNVPQGESITSDGTGVEVNGQAAVNNAGQIAGGVNGVDFAEQGTGTLNNAPTGTVSSDSRAVQINGDGVEINNDGAILGTDDQRNGTIYSNRTADDFTINNNGLVDAGEGNSGAGVSTELVAEGTTFDLNNNGTIQGRGDAPAGAATAGDGVRLERTRVDGQLDGSTSGVFDGSINNNGVIDSEGANGTVAGVRTVNGVDFQGELNNNGQISGTQNGLYFGNETPAGGGDHTGGVVNNNGLISSDSRALNIDGTGLEVNNNGAILGTDDQRNGTVYADSTAQDFELNNNGLIDAGEGNQGAGFSAELSAEGNDFDIENNGAILGRGDAAAGTTAAGDGIRLERERVGGALDGSTTGQFTGDITNNGLVSAVDGANGTVGGFRAVNGVDFQGTLENTGAITGSQNGVYFGTGDHTGGVVDNSGLISSDSRALNIDGDGLTVNNSGSIEATGRQRNGTVYVDGTADNFALDNSGSIDARGGAGSGVSVQVGAETGDVQNGSIVNSGEVVGSGELEQDAGVRLFNEAEGETTFQGDIVNSGRIESEDAAAILVEDGVAFEGDVINSGVIDGEIDLSSGDVVLTDQSVVFLDVAGVDNVEQIDTQGDVTLGGRLNVRFDEGFVPEAGQTFDLIDFGAASGNFSSVEAEGYLLDTNNLAIDGTVTVIGQDGVTEVVNVEDVEVGDTVVVAAGDLDDTVVEDIEASVATADDGNAERSERRRGRGPRTATRSDAPRRARGV